MSINAQPFNPTFKLVGNLVEDQVLVYDSSENAFVNSTNTGGGAGAGFDAAVNEGTGLGVWKGSAGTTLQFKTLLGGSDITITESGDSLIIASTVTETMQTGTNLGTGTGIFDSKDGTTHALKFKSLAVGAGLTLTDDGAGTLTLVNTIAAGTSDADLTLSNLSDNATARTNLGVYSKTESDAKYHKHDDAFVPSANNTFDIGSSTLKYNDIYAETFQGTAVLADNLTTSGTTGQVLTYNGSSWAAADSFDGAYSSLSGKPTLLTNLDGTVKQDIIPDTNIAYDIGSDTKRFKDLYLSGNTISLGSALMSASSSGGISLPSGTTIGPATYGDFRPIKIIDDRGINPNFNGNPVVANSTIIDQVTFLNAVGSFPDTNFVPSVYSATQDGSNNITAITIVTANEYGSEFQDYPGINTDNMMAIDAGIDITNPAEIAASSQQEVLEAGVISASIGGTSFGGAYSSLTGTPTIPTAVSELTNDSGFVTTDTDTTYTAGSGLTLVGTEFSNTAPDQTVALTGSGATTITGTYPNFTIASTNTDTNTTYTAGTGLTLVGTEFQNTSPDQTVSLTGTGATTVTGTYPNFTIDSTNTNTPAGYNNTNWDTAFGWGDHSTQGYLTSITGSTLEALSNVSNVAPQADQHLTWNAITNLWTPSSQSAGSGGYQDSDARNAISVSGDLSYNATTGVISYTTPTDTDTTYTAGTGLTLVGTEFSNTAPDQTVALTGTGATTVTGTYPNFTIDSTDTNTPAGYNNTNWDTAFGWGDHSTAGYLTSETDSQTLSLTGTTLAITGGNNVDLGVLTIDDMADVNITSVSDGQFLKYNNVSGDWENETVTIPTLTSQLTNDAGFLTSETAHYADSDVDSHLNQSNPTSGYVLSWNGSDYAWVSNGTTGAHYTDADARLAISGTTGLSYNNTTGVMALNATIDDLLDVNSTGAALNQVLKWNGTAWSPALDIDTTYTAGTNVAISGSNVISSTDTTYTNVSEFTNDSGYLVSGDLSGYAQTSSLATVATTGAYSDLSGTPSLYTNSDVDSHLNQSNPTQNHVLSWDGSDYSWVAQSGGGSATDKIEEGNSSVEVIDGGSNGHVMFNTNGTDRWQVTSGGHILPEANDTYDIGSADKKVRDLYLGSNSLYIEDNTIKTLGTDLLFNDEDVMDYANLKNKPSIPAQNTGGTGIQVNAGVVSLDANLSNLSNVSSTSPNSGEVLKWDGSEWAPGTDLTSGSSAMNDLSDVDTTGITSGQYLQWNGSAFVASTVSGGGASAIDDLSDVDTTTSSPSNGDVLTWVQADSEWAPAAPSGGSGGGSAVEYFKVNYATNGNLTSITNATSGVSATILSATGGDVEISFSGTNYPPAGILIYGYAYSTNEYVIMPLNKDITTRKVAGGGSAGSPIAFGTMGSVDLTLKLRENDTGASRSFGTDTHAWIMFTVI